VREMDFSSSHIKCTLFFGLVLFCWIDRINGTSQSGIRNIGGNEVFSVSTNGPFLLSYTINSNEADSAPYNVILLTEDNYISWIQSNFYANPSYVAEASQLNVDIQQEASLSTYDVSDPKIYRVAIYSFGAQNFSFSYTVDFMKESDNTYRILSAVGFGLGKGSSSCLSSNFIL
jgi:hypothetical protein